MKDHVIPRLPFGTQTPNVTSRNLKDADRLIRMWVKRILHLNVHTPDASIHASIKDWGLGIMEFRAAVPHILLQRLVRLRENDSDRVGQRLTDTPKIEGLMSRLSAMGGGTPHHQIWREKIKEGALTAGLELTSESSASRGWIDCRPKGWTGKDYIKAVQLHTANLPTAGMASSPRESQSCRTGCNKMNKRETICSCFRAAQQHTGHG